MAIIKPSIPKGTRDYSPDEMLKRNYIFSTIRCVFELYGFSSIETPAMENLNTLLGKYGEEGDKLLFKILNSGDYLSKVDNKNLPDLPSNILALKICEKGLRYDLTVPFARYVVQHQNDITFPFKRYQIQPVWRADRPQKGRYREFYQCDADIIGTNSLLNETELIQIINDVFNRLKTNIEIKINNRKILAGIAELMNKKSQYTDITVAIDKIEKTGINDVIQSLKEKGFQKESLDLLMDFINISGNYKEKTEQLKNLFRKINTALTGIEELETIFNNLEILNLTSNIVFDMTLARGLDYYTGTIIEVKSKDVEIGSICGGGRYDNLTGIFGLDNISGVGISFGADRIYDVLNTLNLFPKNITSSVKLLFVNFGTKEEQYCLSILKQIRKAGINAEIFPDHAKLKKQMNYANDKNIPFVAIIGEEEIKSGIITLKNMTNGIQEKLNEKEVIQKIQNTSENI